MAFSFLAPLAGANEASWLELDQDIASLSPMAAVAGEGLAVSGYIKNYYMSDSDANTGGWGFNAVRVNIVGSVEDVAVKVSWDMKSGSLVLKDAYARWDAMDNMAVTWGQFKRPFLHSFTTSSNKLLFISTTANAANEARDNGVMLNGNIAEMGTWQVAATNGADLATDENYYTARAAFTVMGAGGFNSLEGGRGSSDGTNASIGISYAEENGATFEGDKLGIELAGNLDAIFFHLDMVQYDDTFAGLDTNLGTALADTSPMGITLSYMLDDNMEVAARHEDFDDVDSSTRLSLAFNYYSVLPNKMMWQINYSDISSDDTLLEAQLLQLGLTLSF